MNSKHVTSTLAVLVFTGLVIWSGIQGKFFTRELIPPPVPNPIPDAGDDVLAQKKRAYNKELELARTVIDQKYAEAQENSHLQKKLLVVSMILSFIAGVIAAVAGISATPPATQDDVGKKVPRSKAVIAVAVIATTTAFLQGFIGWMGGEEQKLRNNGANIAKVAATTEKVMANPKSVEDAINAINDLRQVRLENT